jgi:hypothetical protein
MKRRRFRMNGNGFIYWWRKDENRGRIHVCSASPPENPVSFRGADVIDQTLLSDLKQRNINTGKGCASDGQNVKVRFRFDKTSAGNNVARDVQSF